MKTKDLKQFSWYNICYSKPTSKRYYKGPALYVGFNKYEKCLEFYIPENLHKFNKLSKKNIQDQIFPGSCLFPIGSVISEYTGEIPLDYYQLLNR